MESDKELWTGHRLIKRIGKGDLGEVWQATNREGFPVAIKVVSIENDVRYSRDKEVEEVLGHLPSASRHEGLMSISEFWIRDKWLIIEMDLAQGSLRSRFQIEKEEGHKGITIRDLLDYMKEAAHSLDLLNRLPFPLPDGTRSALRHGDVKPENLLIMQGHVRLADFGLIPLLRNPEAGVPRGFSAYAAPEIFHDRVTDSSDQYSLAATYCFLRGGELPHAKWMEKLRGTPPDLRMLPDVERPVVAHALAYEPEKRHGSCAEFVSALIAATPRRE